MTKQIRHCDPFLTCFCKPRGNLLDSVSLRGGFDVHFGCCKFYGVFSAIAKRFAGNTFPGDL